MIGERIEDFSNWINTCSWIISQCQGGLCFLLYLLVDSYSHTTHFLQPLLVQSHIIGNMFASQSLYESHPVLKSYTWLSLPFDQGIRYKLSIHTWTYKWTASNVCPNNLIPSFSTLFPLLAFVAWCSVLRILFQNLRVLLLNAYSQ